jgi:hypothetical protein
MGGISYNVWLRGLCAGVSWFQCVVTWPVCWSVVVPMCGYVACVLECRGSDVWLGGLCAGVSWFRQNHDTPTHEHQTISVYCPLTNHFDWSSFECTAAADKENVGLENKHRNSEV